MHADMFNYRDYVPALVLTVAAQQLEDILQVDYSRPAQMNDNELSAAARAVLDGLNRMVADFKIAPVAREVIDAAKAGVRADLETAQGYERDFKDLVRWATQQQAETRDRRPTRRMRSAHRAILTKLDDFRRVAERELRESERMSAAYAVTLKELDVIAPKVLTDEEQQQVEWIDQRLAALRVAQEKVANNPELVLEVVQELTEHFAVAPPPPGPTPPTQAKAPLSRQEAENHGGSFWQAAESRDFSFIEDSRDSRRSLKAASPRKQLDERFALGLACALVVSVPSFLLGCGMSSAIVLGFAGLNIGLASYKSLKNYF